MRKRFKLSKKGSRRKFNRGNRTNRMNLGPRPMRGGTRL